MTQPNTKPTDVSRRSVLQAGLSLAPLAILGQSVSSDSASAQWRGGWGANVTPAAATGAGEGTPNPIDSRNPAIVWRRGHCEMCDHCEKSCQTLQSIRGHYDIQKTGKPICVHCGLCTSLCKNDAMVERFDYPAARRTIRTPGVTSVISVAPAVRVSLGEMFGYAPGTNVEGQLVGALKKLGFQYVFDTTFGADLTVMEEASELVARLKSGKERTYPMFTSCCPAWVSFAEYWFPEFLPYLSSAKSPMLMQGALVKTWFAQQFKLNSASVASMLVAPCTAKKYEITRPEMNAAGQLLKKPQLRDMDAALTVRELGRWIEESNINFRELEPEPFDSLMGKGTDAGLIFGATGGVMEAALRSAYFFVNNQPAPKELLEFTPIRGMDAVKEAQVDLGDAGKIRVAAVHGGANTRALMEKIRDKKVQYDFVEVMFCPGGCLGGGGQPRVKGKEAFQSVRKERIAGLYSMTGGQNIRCSHENPQVQKAYSDFLLADGQDLRSTLLHTHSYVGRSEELGE